MQKIWENNGTEKIGLVTPTPDRNVTTYQHQLVISLWFDFENKFLNFSEIPRTEFVLLRVLWYNTKKGVFHYCGIHNGM